jgi:predicted acetyltransferase
MPTRLPGSPDRTLLGAQEVAMLLRPGQTGTMRSVVRKIQPEEGHAFRRSVMIPFLDPMTDDPDQVADYELWAAKAELDRSWVVDDGGHFVGNSAVYSMDVTLPAPPGRLCPTIPMAGITAVGIHPTHRRQGLLRQLMATMHDDARSRGEAIAGLEASESNIYGRFGYGLAANLAEYAIDSRASAFAVAVPALELELTDNEGAAKVLPDLFDRQRRTRAAEVNRSRGYWAQFLADSPHQRGKATARFHAVCDEGYVLYSFRANRVTIRVEELRGTSPEIEAGLWRFVLDLDLVGQVVVKRRPVDEPVRWRLDDPRQLQAVGVEDRLYVRILDTVAALVARGYRTEGRLVLDVLPPTTSGEGDDPAPGRWVLEAGPDGAACRRARVGEDADLRLGIAALGSLYMGGFPASLLAAGGRIEELNPGSLVRADELFGTYPAPRSGTAF